MAKKVPASPFVPVEEQPYPIPENWCWVHMGNVFHLQAGKNISAKEIQNEKDAINKYPCFGGNGIRGYVSKYNHDGLYPIIGRQGALCGNINLASGKFYATEHAVPVTCKSIIDKMWAYYALTYSDLNQYATATAQPGLAVSNIIDVPIAIPPFFEQRRIVDRIESLFAKLDEAKEKAQAIVDGFELRKSAMLHKAFTGELTERWRKEHGVGLDSWETSNLSDRFEIVGGVQKKPSRTPKDNPIPYLSVANVFRDRIDLSELRYFEVFDGELDKLRLQDKDLLVVEGNGSGSEIGRCAMWHCELPICIHQNHIIRLRATDSETMPKYVLYFLNSSAGKSIMKERAKTTAGLFNLSTGKIKTIPVPFATVSEQKEIVRILDSFLTQEQQAKEAAEAVLSQIDTMKKAILARAFRGELGTNDPAEEWAGELVKAALYGGFCID